MDAGLPLLRPCVPEASSAPLFQGDACLAPSWPPRDFPWHDFRRGLGEFTTEESGSEGRAWSFLTSKIDDEIDVKVHYRRLSENDSPMYEFLARGSLPVARDRFFALYADTDYRPVWDKTAMSVRELSVSGSSPEAGPLTKRSRVVHWVVKYPWPLGVRDYVIEQEVHSETGIDGDNPVTRCIQSKSLPAGESSPLCVLRPGSARIDECNLNVAFWEDCDKRLNFALLYSENPKVNLPNWLLVKLATSMLPGWIDGAVAVARGYPHSKQVQVLSHYGIQVEAPRSALRSQLTHDPAFRDVDSDAFQSDGFQSEAFQSDAFFSATDSEDEEEEDVEPEVVPVKLCPLMPDIRPLKPGAKRSSTAAAKAGPGSKKALSRKMSAGLKFKIKVDPGDSLISAGDVEEGVLVLSKEERELLLEVIAEKRAGRSSSGWGWCPCRRRSCLGRRRHHKA